MRAHRPLMLSLALTLTTLAACSGGGTGKADLPIRSDTSLLPLQTVPAGAPAPVVAPPAPVSAGQSVLFREPQPQAPGGVDPRVVAAPGASVGSAKAPVVLQEFGDFQCPACRIVAESFMAPLMERYVRPGRVRFSFIQFPIPEIHPNATRAAEASLCAYDRGGETFHRYHDLLYREQDSWAHLADPTARLTELAVQAGVPAGSFTPCLSSKRHAASVQQTIALGRSVGVKGTPTFFVNGRLVEANNGQDLVNALDAAVAASAKR